MSNVADMQEIRQTGFFDFSVDESDPAVAGAINSELSRQQNQIELIASENIVSRAVLQAQGSVFTNKYAEGSNVPSNCLTVVLPMCSPIRARRPMAQ